MSTEKTAEQEKPVKREEVTVKKTLIQGVEKQPGETIEVTPGQKKRLTASGHI